MKIRQHIPNFVDMREDPPDVKFNDALDLFNIPWVKMWHEGPRHSGWSVCGDDPMGGNVLMAERDGGSWWRIVGHLDGQIDLPKWEPNYEGRGVRSGATDIN